MKILRVLVLFAKSVVILTIAIAGAGLGESLFGTW